MISVPDVLAQHASQSPQRRAPAAFPRAGRELCRVGASSTRLGDRRVGSAAERRGPGRRSRTRHSASTRRQRAAEALGRSVRPTDVAPVSAVPDRVLCSTACQRQPTRRRGPRVAGPRLPTVMPGTTTARRWTTLGRGPCPRRSAWNRARVRRRRVLAPGRHAAWSRSTAPAVRRAQTPLAATGAQGSRNGRPSRRVDVRPARTAAGCRAPTTSSRADAISLVVSVDAPTAGLELVRVHALVRAAPTDGATQVTRASAGSSDRRAASQRAPSRCSGAVASAIRDGGRMLLKRLPATVAEQQRAAPSALGRRGRPQPHRGIAALTARTTPCREAVNAITLAGGRR